MTALNLKRFATSLILGASPLLALFAATPASTKVMSATFTTTLTHGVDYTSYFSSPGVTALAGQPIAIEFIYDTSLGLDTSTSTLLQRRGGTDFTADLFILGTTVTIGGTSLGIQSRDQQIWNVVPSANQYDTGSYGFSTDDKVYQVGGVTGALASRDSVAVSGSGKGISADLTKEGSYALTSVNAIIFLTEFKPPYNWTDARYNVTANGSGPGTLVVREVNAVAAVPEPATWALMLLGFGAVGGTMRGRASRTRRMEHIASA